MIKTTYIIREDVYKCDGLSQVYMCRHNDLQRPYKDTSGKTLSPPSLTQPDPLPNATLRKGSGDIA